ncbi:MAG: head-tail connector protein [Pseudomonadota bacterium]
MPDALIMPAATPSLSLAEAKSYLRIDGQVEDALVQGLIDAAVAMAEVFLRQRLMLATWQFISNGPGVIDCVAVSNSPLKAINQIRVVSTAGTVALPSERFSQGTAKQIQSVLFTPPLRLAEDEQLEIDYRAGMAEDWNTLPGGIRQGLLRLIAHFYTYRDDPAVPALPAAVAALWQPFRMPRL